MVNCWNYIAEIFRIFEIQSLLPLTDSDTNQHNSLEMVDKISIRPLQKN